LDPTAGIGIFAGVVSVAPFGIPTAALGLRLA